MLGSKRKVVSRRKEREKYDDQEFYEGVNVYDIDDDDHHDDYDDYGFDDRDEFVGGQRKPLIKRIEALEGELLDGPPASDDLVSRVGVLEEKLQKPNNADDLTLDERVEMLEDTFLGQSRPKAKEKKSVEMKVAKLEKKVMSSDYNPPGEMIKRVENLEKVIRRPGKPASLSVPERVGRLHYEIFGSR